MVGVQPANQWHLFHDKRESREIISSNFKTGCPQCEKDILFYFYLHDLDKNDLLLFHRIQKNSTFAQNTKR